MKNWLSREVSLHGWWNGRGCESESGWLTPIHCLCTYSQNSLFPVSCVRTPRRSIIAV